MEAEWDITAPSAGHHERLRAQRVQLSRALSNVQERTMALSAWRGAYPIGAAAWVNTDKNTVLGGPLNCTLLKERAANSSNSNTAGNSNGGNANTANGAAGNNNNQHNGGGNNNNGAGHNGFASGAAGAGAAGTTASSLALSQQVVVTALHHGTIILYNTLNTNKTTLFVPSDVKTNANSTPGNNNNNNNYGNNYGHTFGGLPNHYGSGIVLSSSTGGGSSSSSYTTVPVDHTIAANLSYGHLSAVAVSPLSYRADNANKMAMGWVFQDAIAVCQLDAAKRDPCVEGVCKLAPIPSGLLASKALLTFSNLFEWGFNVPSAVQSSMAAENFQNHSCRAAASSSSSPSPSACVFVAPSDAADTTSAHPPPRTRFLASVVAEGETATSRLMLAVQTSVVPLDGATNNNNNSNNNQNLFTMRPIAVGNNSSSSSDSSNSPWGLIHGEVIFAEWIANPKPSYLVRRAAVLAEKEAANAAANSNNGNGNNYYGGYRRNHNNYNHHGGHNNYRNNHNNNSNNRRNNYYNNDHDDDGGNGGYNRRGGYNSNATTMKRFEDFLPNGLQPEGGPAMLLLGTSDCRMLLVQVYVVPSAAAAAASSPNGASAANSSTPVGHGNLAWRVISETLVANDCPTQLMTAFNASRSALTSFSDASSVLSTYSAMCVGGNVIDGGGGADAAAAATTATTATTTTASTAAGGAAGTAAGAVGSNAAAGATSVGGSDSAANSSLSVHPSGGGAVGGIVHPLSSAALTTSVTSELMVSFVSIGNVLQNASLEVTWPLMNGVVLGGGGGGLQSSAVANTTAGKKRGREEDEVESGGASNNNNSAGTTVTTAAPSSSTALVATKSSSAIGSSSSASCYYPAQHLMHLQPLTALSTDDFYIQSLVATVFGNIPVFVIALSTGAIITLDGRSLSPLHLFNFERNRQSSLTIPLALVPRELPVMIAVVDDECLSVIKQQYRN